MAPQLLQFLQSWAQNVLTAFHGSCFTAPSSSFFLQATHVCLMVQAETSQTEALTAHHLENINICIKVFVSPFCSRSKPESCPGSLSQAATVRWFGWSWNVNTSSQSNSWNVSQIYVLPYRRSVRGWRLPLGWWWLDDGGDRCVSSSLPLSLVNVCVFFTKGTSLLSVTTNNPRWDHYTIGGLLHILFDEVGKMCFRLSCWWGWTCWNEVWRNTPHIGLDLDGCGHTDVAPALTMSYFRETETPRSDW